MMYMMSVLCVNGMLYVVCGVCIWCGVGGFVCECVGGWVCNVCLHVWCVV